MHFSCVSSVCFVLSSQSCQGTATLLFLNAHTGIFLPLLYITVINIAIVGIAHSFDVLRSAYAPMGYGFYICLG